MIQMCLPFEVGLPNRICPLANAPLPDLSRLLNQLPLDMNLIFHDQIVVLFLLTCKCSHNAKMISNTSFKSIQKNILCAAESLQKSENLFFKITELFVISVIKYMLIHNLFMSPAFISEE